MSTPPESKALRRYLLAGERCTLIVSVLHGTRLNITSKAVITPSPTQPIQYLMAFLSFALLRSRSGWPGSTTPR